jgi:hypothetical protein
LSLSSPVVSLSVDIQVCPAAAVLKGFRGAAELGASVTIRNGASFVEPATATHPRVPAADVTFSWQTFEDAAWDAGMSRRYGGIHWQFGDTYARDVGKKLGEGAFSLAKKLWEGGCAGYSGGRTV